MKQNVSLNQIVKFLEQENIAVAGASAVKKKFGNEVVKELLERKYNVFLLHPTTQEIDGRKCYQSVNDLPSEVSSIHISTSKKNTNAIVEDAIKKGISHIWVQQMSEDETTIQFNKEGFNLITQKCLFMFLLPVKGVHKFHRSINKFFGKLPK